MTTEVEAQKHRMEARPPAEARGMDLLQERVLHAEGTVADLGSQIADLRSRLQYLQGGLPPPAEAGRVDPWQELLGQAQLDADVLERTRQALGDVTRSEIEAVEAQRKAEKEGRIVFEQTRELEEFYRSMAESEGRVTPDQKYADALHLAALTEELRDDLHDLVGSWEAARAQRTEHLQVLEGIIRDLEELKADEQILEYFRGQEKQTSQTIEELHSRANEAAARRKIREGEAHLRRDRLETLQERIEIQEPIKPDETQPLKPLAPKAEEELRWTEALKRAEAERLKKEAADLEKLAKLDRQRADWVQYEQIEPLQQEMDYARSALERLQAIGASAKKINAAKEEISSMRGQLNTALKTRTQLELQARKKAIGAELMRKQVEDIGDRIQAEKVRRRNEKIFSFAMAGILTAITIALATVVRRLVRTKELWSLRGVTDEGKKKRIHMPYLMIRRIAVPLIYWVGALLVLMQFEAFRRIGITILASAGLISLVIGLAARQLLANTIAGITLCFSQPIRVGDTVKIGDEYGTIEDIGLLHTTFRAWDNRHLVIPNEEILLRKEMVNYTLRDQRIQARVQIHLDYAADLQKARSILIDVAKKSKYWNGQEEPAVWFMEMGRQTITLWVAAWADDPSAAWGLSCDIRDNALERFKQEDIPFPRRRVQYEGTEVVLESVEHPRPGEA